MPTNFCVRWLVILVMADMKWWAQPTLRVLTISG